MWRKGERFVCKRSSVKRVAVLGAPAFLRTILSIVLKVEKFGVVFFRASLAFVLQCARLGVRAWQWWLWCYRNLAFRTVASILGRAGGSLV